MQAKGVLHEVAVSFCDTNFTFTWDICCWHAPRKTGEIPQLLLLEYANVRNVVRTKYKPSLKFQGYIRREHNAKLIPRSRNLEMTLQTGECDDGARQRRSAMHE